MRHPGSHPCTQIYLSGCCQWLLRVFCGVCEEGQGKISQTYHNGKRNVLDRAVVVDWMLCICVKMLVLLLCVLQAGNVVTGEMVEELILSGADIIKVGIGPGE